MASDEVLFDGLRWRDPVRGGPLEPIVKARAPSGVPLWGALRIPGTAYAYPIVDCVARLTPEVARQHEAWLAPLGLQPPPSKDGSTAGFQTESSVAHFGFQWSWNSSMRSAEDLKRRAAEWYGVSPSVYGGKVVLDAGAGAGDQSRYIMDQGAQVVSLDLSAAIEVVARKLRMRPGWVGVQGDITALPFAEEQFDMVYCEGVIQHTRDSAQTVRELCRVLGREGLILAMHYGKSTRWRLRMRNWVCGVLRKRWSRWERYKLLLWTGNLAALAYIPVFNWFAKRIVNYSPWQPDFKTTWTDTFDAYGNQAYQRHVTPQEFWSYFEALGCMERVYQNGTIVTARKIGKA